MRHHRGRSIDPTCPSSSQSSSDLSSPNESCYSFVRRALQKLAGTRRNRGGRRPWFLQGLDIAAGTDEIVGAAEQFAYMDCGDDIGGCLEYHPHHHHHYHQHPHRRSNDGTNNGCSGAGGSAGISIADNLIPIELRQLESTEYADLFQQPQQNTTTAPSAPSKAALLFSNVLYPRRRRTLETACGDMGHSTEAQSIGVQPKSKSLSDLLGLLPVGLLRSSQTHHKTHDENGDRKKRHHRSTATSSDGQNHHHANGNRPSLSPLVQSFEDPSIGPYKRHVSVQTEVVDGSLDGTSGTFHLMFPPPPNGSDSKRRVRPLLVKQKHSICSDAEEEEGEEVVEGEGQSGVTICAKSVDETDHETASQDLAQEALENGDVVEPIIEKRSPREGHSPKVEPAADLPPIMHKKLKHQKKSIAPGTMPFWKQTSMNDELIFSERLKEKERLKKQVQKQCSLNEELIYNKGRRGTGPPQENTRWDQMKEAFLKNSSNVKCFQLIKNGLSRGFRGGGGEGSTPTGSSTPSSIFGGVSGENGQVQENGGTGPTPVVGQGGDASSNGGSAGMNGDHLQNHGNGGNGGECYYSQQYSQPQPPRGGTTSLRNGIVRMLQNWKQSEEGNSYTPGSPGSHRYSNTNSSGGSSRRALFPPFFLRRSSAGSLTLVGKQANKQDHHHHHLNHHGQCSSPGPLSPLGKGVGDGGDLNGSSNGSSGGNKLLPGVRHVRKLSREDGSDSSKDSSFQSDTSVDSEDSFASVIFIPKSSGGLDDFGGDFCGTRANSTDSDRSPKSPASRLSPPNHGNLPKSPSPLAQEVQAMMRKKSPEISPAEPGRPKLTPGGSAVNPGFNGNNGGNGGGGEEATKFLFDESATTRLLAGENSGNELLHHTVLSPVASSDAGEDTQPGDQRDLGDVQGIHETITIPPITIIMPPRTLSTGKKRVEKIEVLRKPGVIPEGKSGLTRQLVRRSLPKALAVELFNPETDDADTSDTSSSSPNSVSSVVSVVNEDSSAAAGGTSTGIIDEAKRPIITEEEVDETEEGEEAEELEVDEIEEESGPIAVDEEDHEMNVEDDQEARKSASTGILDVAANVVSSLENLVTQSTSPKTRRKITLAKLGSTSEWLSSLEVQQPLEGVPGASKKSNLKTWKKTGQRNSAEEPIQEQAETGPEMLITTSEPSSTPNPSTSGTNQQQLSVEMLEERDSLFDSMENLNSSNSRQQPSRNPSIDSSVRMSSTCSCSIRGGDSFDSWTSAKSSLTNSSCTQPPTAQHKTSLTSVFPLPASGLPPGVSGSAGVSAQPSKMSSLDSNGTNRSAVGGGALGGGSGAVARRRDAQSRIRVQSSSKSSSAAGEDTEDSTALTCHRYYHVFREGELDKLIEKYVQNLHIISSYYDHANWCIIAEKVQVWTI